MAKLLLDFDGVILKNKNILKYQVSRSAKFVQKHTHLSLKKSHEINKVFYPKYGHTVIMLNELFHKHTTLEEYNEFVFDTLLISKLDYLIDEKTYNHGNAFTRMFECDNTYVFSNAHLHWIEYFSESFDLNIQSKKIIWPQNINNLKPFARAYDTVHEKFGIHTNITFVDDSPKNLEYPKTLSNWNPILFEPEDDIETLDHKLKVYVN